ncbi:MAG: hypothetical protein HY360_00350 [Verrucomicrobia bacterium]|nr:hypothetical protein [Verrucomicrobiota bacterium]
MTVNSLLAASVPSEFLWLQEKVRRLIEAARFVGEAGVSMYYPAPSGNLYPSCYLRDFTYLVESVPEFIPPGHTRAILELFLRNCRADGLCPEKILPSGQPTYVCHGARPAADSGLFLVKLFHAHLKQTNDPEFLRLHFDSLLASLRAVPTEPETGLVWIDPGRPHTGYGFTDTISKTGRELFCSLLLFESFSILCALATSIGCHDDSAVCKAQAENLQRSLDSLWFERDGMFYAASADCRQLDVWGSLYACMVGAVDAPRARRIGDWFEANRDRVLYRGCLRHLPAPEHWNRLILADASPPGTFQNGAYWSTPTGWYAEMLESREAGSGLKLLRKLVAEFQKHGIWECIGPNGYYRLENNLSSIVLPYRSFKTILGRRGERQQAKPATRTVEREEAER